MATTAEIIRSELLRQRAANAKKKPTSIEGAIWFCEDVGGDFMPMREVDISALAEAIDSARSKKSSINRKALTRAAVAAEET